MKIKNQIAFLFFIVLSFHAYARKDTTKMKYVHSYISINAGYNKDIDNNPGWTLKPGVCINASGYFALKESYFGVVAMIGHNQAPFNGSNYEATYGVEHYFIDGESSGRYNEIYTLAGLGLKIPGHTTRYAIEIRAMVGGIICNTPSIAVFDAYQSPLYNESTNEYLHSLNTQSFALDAGIGYGYKITQRWGFMAYCDLMLGKSFLRANNTSINLSGGLVYTFGKMIGNFVY